MRYTVIPVLTAMALLGIEPGTGGGEGGRGAHTTATATTWVEGKAVANDDVELKVRMPRRSTAGDAIVAEMSVTNRSTDRVTYLFTLWSHYRDFVLKIEDSHGKAVPHTRFGKEVWGLLEGPNRMRGMIFGHGRVETLRPGESYRLALNLSLLFDLTLPGEYRLTVSEGRIIDGAIKGRSEPNSPAVRFTVTRPPRLRSVRTAPAGPGKKRQRPSKG